METPIIRTTYAYTSKHTEYCALKCREKYQNNPEYKETKKLANNARYHAKKAELALQKQQLEAIKELLKAMEKK